MTRDDILLKNAQEFAKKWLGVFPNDRKKINTPT